MSRNRRRKSHRKPLPDVICLPPPKQIPATLAPGSTGSERAIPLQQSPETLVAAKADTVAEPMANRQQRRKTSRVNSRTERRHAGGLRWPVKRKLPVGFPMLQPAIEHPVRQELAPSRTQAAMTEPGGEAGAIAPLPRSRSLALPNNRMIARIVDWIGSYLARKFAPPDAVLLQPTVDQLVGLRAELASVQQRLDRMIAGATREAPGAGLRLPDAASTSS